MTVNGHKSQYRTKFQDNAPNIWEAKTKNRVVFSIFSIKITCCRYSGNLKFYMMVNGHELQYRTKFQDNAPNIWEARTKNKEISVFLL